MMSGSIVSEVISLTDIEVEQCQNHVVKSSLPANRMDFGSLDTEEILQDDDIPSPMSCRFSNRHSHHDRKGLVHAGLNLRRTREIFSAQVSMVELKRQPACNFPV